MLNKVLLKDLVEPFKEWGSTHIDFSDYSVIPEDMIEAIRAYVVEGQALGHFLYALMTNDLNAALARADTYTKLILPTYVMYVHWQLPACCHGSAEKVKAWMQEKRAS